MSTNIFKRTIWPLILIALFLLPSAVLFGQDIKKINIREAVNYTLKNHPSNITYSNDIKIAKQKATEALSAYLPQINGTGTLDDNLERQTTIIPAGTLSPKEIKLQLGTQFVSNVYAEMDQTIYDQTLINSLKANKPNEEISELKKVQNEDNLVYNTATSYYQVLIYQEQEKLLIENEKKLQEILNIQKLQFDKGFIKQVDYDRVRVNLISVQSQKKQAQTNIELALNQLKNAMGMTLDSKITVADSLNTTKDIPVLTVSNNYDVKNNFDYQIQSKNLILQQIDLSRKQATYLPTLTGYARYGAQALGNDFGQQYQNFFPYSVIGLKLNVPIFSGFRRSSQIMQSGLSLYNARQNLTICANNIQLQMINSNTQLQSSYNTLTSNKENLELATDVLQTTTLQYKEGVASASDLLNSDYGLKEAQANYINSLYNYLISTLEVQKSQGTIKQYVNQL